MKTLNSAATVAKTFLQVAEQGDYFLTNTKLQNLVYLAHHIHLAAYKTPLFNEKIEAFDFGPVICNLYNELKIIGNKIVPFDFFQQKKDLVGGNGSPGMAIAAIWKSYGHYSEKQLHTVVTKEETPWHTVWHQENFAQIPDELAITYYKNSITKK